MTWTMKDYDEASAWREQKRIRNRFPGIATVPFECLSGWFPLLEKMLEDIRKAIPPGFESMWNLRQVKEKMAGLRAYHSYGSEREKPTAQAKAIQQKIERAVALAEARADRTCEVCGGRGVLSARGGWYTVRCQEHADGTVPCGGRPPLRYSRYEYDEATDDVIDLALLTYRDVLDREAQRRGEEIEWAVIGEFLDAPPWIDDNGWPGWEDPVPRHKRRRVEPWDRAGPALSYPLASERWHPVTAWTKSWVITIERRDRYGFPDARSYLRSPGPVGEGYKLDEIGLAVLRDMPPPQKRPK